MEPTPGRSSRDLPDGFSKLEKKLRELRTKFIQQFDIKEPRMREIVEELLRICGQVKRTQENTDGFRTGGVVAGGVGLLAALFSRTLSLAAAVAGGAAVVAVGAANVVKTSFETDSVKAVEKLGREFKRIIEPLKGTLEEIKETCKTLELRTAEYQSGYTLLNMKEFEENLGFLSDDVLKQVSEKDIRYLFKDFLKQVSELKVQIKKTQITVESCNQMIKSLLILIVNVLRFTPTPEQDKQLRDSIIQLPKQGQKVIDECEKIQTHLEEVPRQLSELREQMSRALLES